MFDRVLIIDEDGDALRESLSMLLSAEGCDVVSAASSKEALERLDETPVDLILCDLRMPGVEGFDLVPQLARKTPGVPVVLLSTPGTTDPAAEAVERGAYDYLTKPLQHSEVVLLLRKTQERGRLRRSHELLQRDHDRIEGTRPIVAASESMIDLLELIERTAAYKTTTLLTGESGTGKEVIARAIHAQSPRRAEPFVAVDCGAIPESQLESELFGHVKGALAGADRARSGLFAEADGGTIFLDRIEQLPLPLQVKTLHVLQEEAVRPVGDSKSQAIDVRVIAATARDLEQEISAGRFREDLSYRLEVVQLHVPALRDRREDIPLLVDHFLTHFRRALGKGTQGIADDALERLTAHHWPGNLRELENVMERAMILSDGDWLTLDCLPQNIVSAQPGLPDDAAADFGLKEARRAFEARMIRRALRATNGNRTHAARLLEISHRALLYKIKEYGARD